MTKYHFCGIFGFITHESIIAPHLDDAVLSVWHQIEQTGSQTVTVFTGVPDQANPSWWDRLTGQADAQATMHIRKTENTSALANTPTRITNLNLLDRPYTKDARDIGGIADRVEASIPSDAPIIVAAGVGTLLRRHPDHESIRRVGLELRERGRDITFYADIPYSLPVRNFENWPTRLQAEKLKRLLGSDVEIETIELSEDEQEHKRIAIHAFKTQFKMVNMLALGALNKAVAYKYEALIYCA